MAGPIIVREDLSPFVDRLAYKETPLRDRLMRKKGTSIAASWNVMTAMGVGNSPFAEAGTPTEDATSYVRRSAIHKELGKTKSISDKMLAAGASFMDQEAEQTEVAMREVLQDEENLIINGDSGLVPTQFDGLKTIITTNVVNDNNNALGFRPDLLNEQIAHIFNTYGARVTAIVCSYDMANAINNYLLGDVRVNIQQSTDGLTVGTQASFFQSMLGRLPIIATPAVANDTSTYAGHTVSDIYLLTERSGGGEFLYLSDLYPLGKEMLARTGAAIKFMVTESTVLICRAEEMQQS